MVEPDTTPTRIPPGVDPIKHAASPVEEVITAIGNGQFALLVDEVAQGPGVLAVAAERATPNQLAHMIRRGGGIISVPLTETRLQELDLPLMVPANTDVARTAFTVSVDAKEGTTTGISAADRWETIRTLISEDTKPGDLLRPGHVYPLRYVDGGVLRRAGYAEAAVDLVRAAGLYPAAVLTDIMSDEGGLLFGTNLADFADQHDIPLCRIADVIAFRRLTDKLVAPTFETVIASHGAEFRAVGFRSLTDGSEHLALLLGDIGAGEHVLVRVHSECLAGDVFSSNQCACSANLDHALDLIVATGRGVLLYLRRLPQGGGGPLERLLRHTREGIAANDPSEDQRDYGTGAQILHRLGVRSMQILTDRPADKAGLEGHGLSIESFSPLTGRP